MNSAWAKLGLLAAGVALGVAAVKLLENDKVIVIREQAAAKVKDTAEQAVEAGKSIADQVKSAVAEKFSKTCEPETIVFDDADDASFNSEAETEPSDGE